MRISLQVKSGPLSGRRIDVRDGQVASFGATEWADYSFPDDPKMQDVHFSLHCEHASCLLRPANPDAETSVNGEAVEEVALHTGDEIVAGHTRFAVSVEGEEADPGNMREDSEEPSADASDSSVGVGLAETCEYLELPDEAIEIAVDSSSAESFLASLIEAELFTHAIRWQAHALPKADAVRWGCDCANETLPAKVLEAQREGIDAARAWADDPTEERRRAAEAEAERLDYEGAGGMLAAAAFWSEGSLTPADVVPVPPDERLTGQAVAAALLIVAAEDDPAQAPIVYRQFLDRLQVGSSE